MEKSLYSTDYKRFVQLLRESREAAGITQECLAERLGQTQSFVSKCERAERRVDLVEARAYCIAIGLDFLDFIRRLSDVIEKGGSK